MFDKPIPQFRRDRRDVIRKNRDEPIEAARDAVGQPGGTDKSISGQFVRHEIDRVVEQRSAREPLGHDSDERAFVVMRMDNVDSLLANDSAEQAEQLEVEDKFIR